MPIRDDEPLPATPDEIEEISTDFIIQDEPTEPEIPAPVPTDDPFVAASRALVDASAHTGEIAPRAAVPVARAAPREPARPIAGPPNVQGAPAPPSPPEPGARRQGFPLVAALLFLLVGAGAGFLAGVLWERQSRVAPAVAAPTATAAGPEAAGPDVPASEEKAEPKGEARRASRGARTAKPAAKTAATAAGKPLEARG